MAAPQIKIKLDRKRFYVEPSVIVFKEGDTIYVLDAETKALIKSGSNASEVIQYAIDYVADVYKGGKIYLKHGVYELNAPIKMNYNVPLALVGEAPFRQEVRSFEGITLLKYIGPAGSSDDDAVSVINCDSGNFLGDQYVLLKDITIALLGKAYPYTRAVNLNRVNKFWVEKVQVFADPSYNPATRSFGFYTDQQGGNGGVMIDTFSSGFHAAYKFYLDHLVSIRAQALYSRWGFWLHYGVGNVVLIQPHALSCSDISFLIGFSYGTGAVLINPYSEGAPNYDYYIDTTRFVTLINPLASRSPPVIYFGNVDFSKVRVVGGQIKLGINNFKRTGLSVSVGTGGAYGPATEITSPSGEITYPRVKITWVGTFGTGETVTVKVEAVYHDNSTAYVEKSATSAGSVWLTDDDIMSLITQGKDIVKLNVYAKSSATSTNVTVKVDAYGKA